MSILSVFKKAKKSASHTQDQLIPRKVKFDWQNTPIDWLPNQPFASHFVNEINMILPAFGFAIKAIVLFRPRNKTIA